MHRISIVTGWLALAFIVYATLCPIDARPVIAGLQLEHFAAFGLVGLAFGLAYPNRLMLVIVILVGGAFALEALQLVTPDRHGRLIDALMKAAGAMCGIGLAQFGQFLLRRQAEQTR